MQGVPFVTITDDMLCVPCYIKANCLQDFMRLGLAFVNSLRQGGITGIIIERNVHPKVFAQIQREGTVVSLAHVHKNQSKYYSSPSPANTCIAANIAETYVLNDEKLTEQEEEMLQNLRSITDFTSTIETLTPFKVTESANQRVATVGRIEQIDRLRDWLNTVTITDFGNVKRSALTSVIFNTVIQPKHIRCMFSKTPHSDEFMKSNFEHVISTLGDKYAKIKNKDSKKVDAIIREIRKMILYQIQNIEDPYEISMPVLRDFSKYVSSFNRLTQQRLQERHHRSTSADHVWMQLMTPEASPNIIITTWAYDTIWVIFDRITKHVVLINVQHDSKDVELLERVFQTVLKPHEEWTLDVLNAERVWKAYADNHADDVDEDAIGCLMTHLYIIAADSGEPSPIKMVKDFISNGFESQEFTDRVYTYYEYIRLLARSTLGETSLDFYNEQWAHWQTLIRKKRLVDTDPIMLAISSSFGRQQETVGSLTFDTQPICNRKNLLNMVAEYVSDPLPDRKSPTTEYFFYY